MPALGARDARLFIHPAPVPPSPVLCSKWGALRAAMGHPEPWAINYMAIGNEVGLLLLHILEGEARWGLGWAGSAHWMGRAAKVQLGTSSWSEANRRHAHLPLPRPRLSVSAPYRFVPQDCGKPMYLQNYLLFFGALRARYPHLRLISNCDMGTDAPTGGQLGGGAGKGSGCGGPCNGVVL
jgi:alpha-N-arabinofuranosidase